MSWQPDDNLDLFRKVSDTTAPISSHPSRILAGTPGTAGTSTKEPSKNSRLAKKPDTVPTGNTAGTPGTNAPMGQETDPQDGDPLTPEIKRPCFANHNAPFVVDDKVKPAGLWWHGTKQRNGELVSDDVRIADPIEVTAISRDEHGGNFGRQLRFRNSEGRWCERVLPMRLLSEGGSELRRELLDMGHTHSLKHRAKLADFIMDSHPKGRIVAATTTGWHDNASAFVLPHRTLGNQDYSFSAEAMRATYFETRGTLAGWREDVASKANNNPIMVMCVCVALAGPLIWPAKQQAAGGLGFNLRGGSSKGKTTGLQIAASVWGSPQFLRPWAATGNGVEALAASQNDTCMVLDELSQANPHEAGSMVYMVANGVGKQRAARTGGIREAQRWRLMLLSSGERSLASHMGEAGKTAKAGQDARLLDIPATGRRYGAFDDTQGMNPSDFANAIKSATAEHYGHAGMAFINYLLKRDDLPALYHEIMQDPAFIGTQDGVSSRAAGAFGLLAMAGELATEAGITGWQPGYALDAIATCFALWQNERGSLPPEDTAILEGVRSFIERHGDSRFSELVPTKPDYLPDQHQPTVHQRAGYWSNVGNDRVFYFQKAELEEAAKGFDAKTIAAVLDDANWLYEKEAGRLAVNKRVNGTIKRLYAVLPKEADQ
ncbi:DUF927 domain-containing protein [Vreelandella andesensis]|uniref:DUF927 domain-containing protein n=1 Tax=Vreelandella andesensis TaxID=447567 RepID=A0A433KFD7_9GAMM|nr:DUF927 domain-containing protein [Halomonas andesensis]RUR27316.1 DUF927 domain-containing protein [Halomonas andesensis]